MVDVVATQWETKQRLVTFGDGSAVSHCLSTRKQMYTLDYADLSSRSLDSLSEPDLEGVCNVLSFDESLNKIVVSLNFWIRYGPLDSSHLVGEYSEGIIKSIQGFLIPRRQNISHDVSVTS